MNRWRSLLLALSVIAAGTQPRAAADDPLTRSTLDAEQRLLGLSVLWSEARVSFAYFDKVAATWDAWYRAFIPRVQAASSDYQYYLELMRFYAHLEDGHSGVFWPASFDDALGYPPIEIRKIEGRAVIVRLLEQNDELLRNGIRPGVAILEVNRQPVAASVDEWRALKTGSTPRATDRLAYFRILTGPRHSEVEVLLEEPDGTKRIARLTRSAKYFNDTNLDPPELYATRRVDGGIGYFQANQMSKPVADAFAAYMDSNTTMAGLVLDLRYNGGGADTSGFDMVSRLTDQSLDGPIYEVTSYRADRRATRQEQERIRVSAGRIAPARGRRFTGWLVVLIGEQTHSAAESGFLSVIGGRPRTVFVGEPTAGSTGQPMIFALPGGAIGAVCSRRTLAPDGRSFVGTGFQPDVTIGVEREDLFAGRDRVLDKGIEVLKARLESARVP